MAFGKYILNASTAKECCVFLTGVEKTIPDMKLNMARPGAGPKHDRLSEYGPRGCSPIPIRILRPENEEIRAEKEWRETS
jgi:hypothetical protein